MKTDKIKIFTVFGTRPEVIKLFPVLKEINRSQLFSSRIVSTAQHREMVEDLLALFTIKPDHDLDIMRKNQSLIDISRRALAGLAPLLEEYNPDLVLVQGDTTTAFIGALAAFYNRIAVGHVEAGLRSYDKRHPYPEEINRRMISVAGDLHFAPTHTSYDNLVKEGIDQDNIFVTGNTVIDSLLYVAGRNRGTLEQHLPFEVLGGKRLILVTSHRRENWGGPLENLCYALRDLAKSFPEIVIVYPVHLNPNVRSTVFSILSDQERIHLLDPLPYEPFIEAMVKADIIITDSGGIQEEGPSFGKPILVFREVTERPEGFGTSGLKLVGLKREDVFKETSDLLENQNYYKSMTAEFNPYGDGKAAQRILQAILYWFGKETRPKEFNPK